MLPTLVDLNPDRQGGTLSIPGGLAPLPPSSLPYAVCGALGSQKVACRPTGKGVARRIVGRNLECQHLDDRFTPGSRLCPAMCGGGWAVKVFRGSAHANRPLPTAEPQ